MDVLVERRMRATPEEVAALMFAPENDPRWIAGAKSVERLTSGPLRVGSQVRRHGRYFGCDLAWTTEITALDPPRHLAMDIVEGPMRGTVVYTIRAEGAGALVGIRNSGRARFQLPGMAYLVRRSVAADLNRLAALVEPP
jgi:uncharacterized protein YndB with AHSA1/START domain